MLTGTQIKKLLPEKETAGPQVGGPCFLKRDNMIVNLVKQGNFVLDLVPLRVDYGKYRATFYVSSEPLRLGTRDDSFRASMSACAEQNIADALGLVLPTAKLVDDIYRHADIRVDPPVLIGPALVGGKQLPSWVGNIGATSRTIYHHDRTEKRILQAIDEEFGGEVDRADLLVSNVGKHWVCSKRLDPKPLVQGLNAAINYGWYTSSHDAVGHAGPVTPIPGVEVWQTPGMAHPFTHADYSQTAIFVARIVWLCEPEGVAPVSGFGAVEGLVTCPAGESCTLADGKTKGRMRCVDIYDLAQDKNLWPLVNHDGRIFMRQPGVEWSPPVHICSSDVSSGDQPGICQLVGPDSPPPVDISSNTPPVLPPPVPVVPPFPPPPEPPPPITPPTPPPEHVAEPSALVNGLALASGVAAAWYGFDWLLDQIRNSKRRRG